jgi:hypothetical protein
MQEVDLGLGDPLSRLHERCRSEGMGLQLLSAGVDDPARIFMSCIMHGVGDTDSTPFLSLGGGHEMRPTYLPVREKSPSVKVGLSLFSKSKSIFVF